MREIDTRRSRPPLHHPPSASESRQPSPSLGPLEAENILYPLFDPTPWRLDMFRRIRVLPLSLLAAVGVIGTPRTALVGQQTTGAVEGRVIDMENGRPITGAR